MVVGYHHFRKPPYRLTIGKLDVFSIGDSGNLYLSIDISVTKRFCSGIKTKILQASPGIFPKSVMYSQQRIGGTRLHGDVRSSKILWS